MSCSIEVLACFKMFFILNIPLGVTGQEQICSLLEVNF